STAESTFKGFKIPKNTIILFSPYLSNRDPKVFTNPYAFSPERWDPSLSPALIEDSLSTFGAGPHACFGREIATMELILFIYAVLKEYSVEFLSRKGFHIPVISNVIGPPNSTFRLSHRSEK